MRCVPALKERMVKLAVVLHYLGRTMFLMVMLRLALVMWLIPKGLKEKLLWVELKFMKGVVAVFEPVIA